MCYLTILYNLSLSLLLIPQALHMSFFDAPLLNLVYKKMPEPQITKEKFKKKSYEECQFVKI